MLWRVIYNGSCGQYFEGEGIWAEDQDSGITFDSDDGMLRWVFGGYLIWWLRRASPFISAYSNKRVAWKNEQAAATAAKSTEKRGRKRKGTAGGEPQAKAARQSDVQDDIQSDVQAEGQVTSVWIAPEAPMLHNKRV